MVGTLTMTIPAIVISCTCGGIGVAFIAAALDGPAANPQDWTLLGLVAALTLGIGTRMIIALDKNTAAGVDQAKALAALAAAIDSSSKQHDRDTRDIRESVEELQQIVTARLPIRP